MATLTIFTPQATIAGAGAPAVFTPANAAAGGDQFLNDGRTILYFKNTNATTRTITIATAGVVAGLPIDDVAFTVAQNEVRIIGPFSPRYFNDANGYIQLTYSDVVTLLTVAAIRCS